MVNNLSQIKEQLLNLWNNFDKKVKIIIITAVLFTFVGMLVLANWASQPEYTVLFNNLSIKDAGSIVNQLKEKQADYKLQENGTSVLVPKKDVYNLRLELASEGLPTGGGVGFEIFDRNQIGSTDFEQKVNYTRAISGELTRTIQALDSVEYAKVQITPSKTSIYKDKEEPAKASVIIKLKEYTELTNKQIEAIANLVAGSVNGLKADMVTIVDTNGNLLSARLKDQSDNQSNISDKFALKNNIEEEIEKDLDMLLTKVLGVNKYSLTVNAELNFDKRNVERKTYQPIVGEEGVIRSKQTMEESKEGNTNNPEGVPGTTSNLPQYKVNNQKEDKYEKEEAIINYEINEEVEHYIQDSGRIERISVAVTLDTSNGTLDAQKKEDITQLISTAVGYSNNRDDQITVIGYPFNNDLELENQKYLDEASRNRMLVITALIIVGLLIISIVVIRRKGKEELSEEAGQNIDYMIDEAQDEFAATDSLSAEEKEKQRLQQQLKNIIKDQPEEIAGLIKSWIAED